MVFNCQHQRCSNPPCTAEVTFPSVNEDILNHSDKKAEVGGVSKILPETACSSPTLGGKIATVFDALKNQGYLSHLIVVTVAVLLLMQVFIMFLHTC